MRQEEGIFKRWEDKRGGSRMKTKDGKKAGEIMQREGEGTDDWRAAGEMNGGQASEGPPLSGQCVCMCVCVESFDCLPVTERDGEWVTREFERHSEREICKERGEE